MRGFMNLLASFVTPCLKAKQRGGARVHTDEPALATYSTQSWRSAHILTFTLEGSVSFPQIRLELHSFANDKTTARKKEVRVHPGAR